MGARRPRTWRRIALAGALASMVALAVAAPAGAVGIRDFSYAGVSAPTADKPQSKLWLNNGFWWATMWSTATARHEIYRLDWATQTWSTTGVPIDTRHQSTADTLWDGSHLYVVSSGPNAGLAAQSARVFRFSYDRGAKTYALDPGFPVTVSAGGMEEVVIARDTTGELWVTYTQNNQVFTAHTTIDDLHWSTPTVLPVPQATTLLPDDIATVIAYDGRIGVMWSNQGAAQAEAFYFAIHVDGTPDSQWTLTTPSMGDHLADDHINLKSLSGDASGRVFAATKTSLTMPGLTLQQLLVMAPNGTWSQHPFGTVAENQTRSQVVIDTEHRQLYMFVTAPCCNGGVASYKVTSLDNIGFAPGPPTPFISLASDPSINNLTTTKQNLSSSTGLVMLAGDDSTDFYVHGVLPLGPDSRAPDTTIDAAPSGTVATDSADFSLSSDEVTSRFQCSLDGGAFGACSAAPTFGGLANGDHTLAARAIDASGNVDATPASAGWTVAVSPATAVAAASGAAPLAVIRLSARSVQRLGRAGRLRMTVRCSEPCRAVVRVSVPGAGSVHAVRRLPAGRTVTVVLRLKRAQRGHVRRLLARGRRVRVVVTATATDSVGRRLVAVRRTVRLR
ncbi:MAG: serralysin [Solirubrobacteraceae bacterium]|nr:serralysin [Solirubrobacteraceae bacterium]